MNQLEEDMATTRGEVIGLSSQMNKHTKETTETVTKIKSRVDMFTMLIGVAICSGVLSLIISMALIIFFGTRN